MDGAAASAAPSGAHVSTACTHAAQATGPHKHSLVGGVHRSAVRDYRRAIHGTLTLLSTRCRCVDAPWVARCLNGGLVAALTRVWVFIMRVAWRAPARWRREQNAGVTATELHTELQGASARVFRCHAKLAEAKALGALTVDPTVPPCAPCQRSTSARVTCVPCVTRCGVGAGVGSCVLQWRRMGTGTVSTRQPSHASSSARVC